ncbi:unnamed protein product [Heterobilharzia americana]|nr:unnamed protein product [Heterobilharzia americana]
MSGRLFKFFYLIYVLLKTVRTDEHYEVFFRPTSLFLEQGESELIKVGLNETISYDVSLEFTYWDRNNNEIQPENLSHSAINPISDVTIAGDQEGPSIVIIVANLPGHINLKIKPSEDVDIANLNTTICHITVVRYRWLSMLQVVIGWLYFAAWTVSFYPQLFLNWKRKSVVGFNFDFAVLNVIGFLYYSIYNVGLFWIPLIQKQYLQRNPLSTIPVQINDLVFAFHALAISSLTAFQILIYERGDQRVSKLCLGLIGLIIVYSVIVCILGGVNVVIWLDTFYLLSHVKLFISFVKYAPQAIMNFRRKSTVGWSIGNIVLDFSGGILSLAQMGIIAYNNSKQHCFLLMLSFVFHRR